MKTLSCSSIYFILCILFVFNSAHAAPLWMDVHGTTCVIQNPGNTINASAPANTAVFYNGLGLDLTEKANTQNWIHCPVPITGSQQTARFIIILYYKSVATSKIKSIGIYNGYGLVATAIPPAGVVGWNLFSVDLGSFRSFILGLDVSLNIAPLANTRFIISNLEVLYQ